MKKKQIFLSLFFGFLFIFSLISHSQNSSDDIKKIKIVEFFNPPYYKEKCLNVLKINIKNIKNIKNILTKAKYLIFSFQDNKINYIFPISFLKNHKYLILYVPFYNSFPLLKIFVDYNNKRELLLKKRLFLNKIFITDYVIGIYGNLDLNLKRKDLYLYKLPYNLFTYLIKKEYFCIFDAIILANEVNYNQNTLLELIKWVYEGGILIILKDNNILKDRYFKALLIDEKNRQGNIYIIDKKEKIKEILTSYNRKFSLPKDSIDILFKKLNKKKESSWNIKIFYPLFYSYIIYCIILLIILIIFYYKKTFYFKLGIFLLSIIYCILIFIYIKSFIPLNYEKISINYLKNTILYQETYNKYIFLKKNANFSLIRENLPYFYSKDNIINIIKLPNRKLWTINIKSNKKNSVFLYYETKINKLKGNLKFILHKNTIIVKNNTNLKIKNIKYINFKNDIFFEIGNNSKKIKLLSQLKKSVFTLKDYFTFFKYFPCEKIIIGYIIENKNTKIKKMAHYKELNFFWTYIKDE